MSLIDWHGDPTARFQAAQRFVDSEVLRRCTPYVPMDTGELIRSGLRETKIGGGEVIYKTPYARRWYHEPARFDGRPMRGSYWFISIHAPVMGTTIGGKCEEHYRERGRVAAYKSLSERRTHDRRAHTDQIWEMSLAVSYDDKLAISIHAPRGGDNHRPR